MSGKTQRNMKRAMKKTLSNITQADKAEATQPNDTQFADLLEALGDSDPDVRREAAQNLGDLVARKKKAGRMVAVPSELIKTLYDSDSGVREAASWALGIIADPDTTPALASRLQDEERRVQSRAAWALSRIRTPKALAAVEAWYADQRMRDYDAD